MLLTMRDFIKQQVKFSLDFPSESYESQDWYTRNHSTNPTISFAGKFVLAYAINHENARNRVRVDPCFSVYKCSRQ